MYTIADHWVDPVGECPADGARVSHCMAMGDTSTFSV